MEGKDLKFEVRIQELKNGDVQLHVFDHELKKESLITREMFEGIETQIQRNSTLYHMSEQIVTAMRAALRLSALNIDNISKN